MISLYRNAKDAKSTETTTIEQFLSDVKTGKWREHVEAVRGGKMTKTECPMVTVSGYFRERRAEALISHSAFICVDIDKVGSEQELHELYDQLCADKYTYAIFRSISGTGIAVVVQIDPDRHRDAFDGLEKYYAENYHIPIDRSCKDVSRTRFISYDPYLFKPHKPVKFKSYIPQKSQPKSTPAPVFTSKDFQDILDYITTNGTDLTNSSYHDWFRIGFAIADEFSENGRSYFHTISAQSEKYDPNVCDKQYNACLKSRGTGITIGTFFHYCKLHNVPYRSEATTAGMRSAEQAKKQGRNKDSAVRAMVEIQGIDPVEATEIADKVFAQPYTPEPSNNPVDIIGLFLSTNYQLRFNEITTRVENNGRPMTDRDFNSAYINLKKIEPKVRQDLFNTYIKSDSVPSYNPLREFLESNAHRTPLGTINALASTISGYNGYAPSGDYYPDYIATYLTKFYLGLIAGALGDETPPIVPVLFGAKMGVGKTEFWKRLLPAELSSYFAISDLSNHKDDDILLCQKWLVCDDEWGGELSKSAKFMKNKTGANSFTLRKAYGKEHEDYKRIAMLCGTANNSDLFDDSNNRRIIPIHVESINLEAYTAIDKTDCLIEAYHLYTSAGESPFLNPEQTALLDQLSKTNQVVNVYTELLDKYFEPYDPEIPANAYQQGMSATDILEFLLKNTMVKNITAQAIGRALTSGGYTHETTYSAGTKKTRKVYHLIARK